MLSALSFYRFANSLSRWHVPLLPKLLDYASRFLFACWFPHTIRAGKGVVLGYGGLCIVVHSDVELGNGVHIDQCVTIGGNGTQYGVPKIGNDVYIGAGAKILGPIMIGEGSVIGANAVVTKDIPPRSLAVGVPARIIRMDVDIDTFLYHKRVDAP